MAKKEFTYEEIIKDLKAKKYYPIYYLMGDEPYYIDKITDYIVENVLTETEKDFNLSVVYGADVDVYSIMDMAKRYPMMSDYQVVVVKEAQMVAKLEELVNYVAKPLNSTLLVICHKQGTLDRRKKLAGAIEKQGVLFESKRIREGQLPAFITSYLKMKKLDIEPKAAAMMAEFVGTDLARLSGELDKLALALPANQTRVTPELIERNIGISKDFNNFELNAAIINKDVYKANLIVKYFSENPKTNPIQMTLALLFNFFSNLMLAYYAPEKSERGVAEFLGLRNPWQARDYLSAMRRYSGVKTMQIVGYIRTADALSKGVDNSTLSDGDILRELVYRILH